tara:strand:+ start:357 stop:524 length:168 start_codon:yes stop_codon:yes gene_type:complete
MKIGDLVTKNKGYGQSMQWVGLVVGFVEGERNTKLLVLTEGEIEGWIKVFCKKIK